MGDEFFLKIIDKLITTYKSIDFKCAIMKKGEKWINIVSVLNFTDIDSYKLAEGNKSLERRWGKIDTKNFKIICKVYRIEIWEDILKELLEKNQLTLNEYTIDFERNLNLQNWNCHREIWSSDIRIDHFFEMNKFFQIQNSRYNFFNGLMNYDHETRRKDLKKLNQEIRENTTFNSIYSVIETWIGLKKFEHSYPYFIILMPIFAKIMRCSIKDQTLNILVKYHENLLDLRGIIELKSNGIRDNIPFSVEKKNSKNIKGFYSQFTFIKKIPSISKEDRIFIQLLIPSIAENLDFFEIRRPTYYYGLDIGLDDLSNLPISELIKEDESNLLEFKASFKYDLKTKRLNKELEYEVAKTIAAFLNSSGGILIIGVKDDTHKILGLEGDFSLISKRMQSKDGYELLLNEVIKRYIDIIDREFIEIRFLEIEGKNICKIKVNPSSNPVFIKKKKKFSFVIRFGNQTRSLTMKDTIDYIIDHWKYEKGF